MKSNIAEPPEGADRLRIVARTALPPGRPPRAFVTTREELLEGALRVRGLSVRRLAAGGYLVECSAHGLQAHFADLDALRQYATRLGVPKLPPSPHGEAS